MSGVYIAAPLAQAARAGALAHHLSQRHVWIASTWHLGAGDCDPLDEAERRRILDENTNEIERAQILVALTDVGTPRATIGEIVWAIALGLAVVWVHGPAGEGRNVWDAHPQVRRVCLEPGDDWQKVWEAVTR